VNPPFRSAFRAVPLILFFCLQAFNHFLNLKFYLEQRHFFLFGKRKKRLAKKEKLLRRENRHHGG